MQRALVPDCKVNKHTSPVHGTQVGDPEWKSLQSNAERDLDLHLRFASEGCLNSRGSGLILTSTSAALTPQVYSLATVKVEKGSYTRGSPSFWCLGWFSFFLQRPCLQKVMQPPPSLQGRTPAWSAWAWFSLSQIFLGSLRADT